MGHCRNRDLPDKKDRQRKGENMLDWLKSILGDEVYTEDVDKKVSDEIGKHFVSRADFNTKSETVKSLEKQLKERDSQLEQLKTNAGDAENLKQQIATLQEQNKNDKAKYESDIAQLKMNTAVETALSAAGAKNIVATKALLAEFLASAEFDEDGAIKGLSDEIAKLSSGEGTAFLFESKEPSMTIKGMRPGMPGGNSPTSIEVNYETRLAEARKNGNTAAAVAIKREAADNGVYLT